MNILSARDDRLGSRLLPALQAKAMYEIRSDLFTTFTLYWPTETYDGHTIPLPSNIFSTTFADQIYTHDLPQSAPDRCFNVVNSIDHRLLDSSSNFIEHLERHGPFGSVLFTDPNVVFKKNSDVLKFCHSNWNSFFSDDVLADLLISEQRLNKLGLSQNANAIHCRRGDIFQYLADHELWPFFLGRVVTKLDLMAIIYRSDCRNWVIFSDDPGISAFIDQLNNIFGGMRFIDEQEIINEGALRPLLAVHAMSRLSTIYCARSALSNSALLFSDVELLPAASIRIPETKTSSASKIYFDDIECLLFCARSVLIFSKRGQVSESAMGQMLRLLQSLPVNNYSCSYYLELFGSGSIDIWPKGRSFFAIKEHASELLKFCSDSALSKLYSGYWLEWSFRKRDLIQNKFSLL